MKRMLVAMVVLGITAATMLGVRAQERDAVMAGERVFRTQGCYGCHTVGKFGTPIGPDLSRVGSKYSEEYLRRWLRDPEAQRPGAHMPKLELDGDEVRALGAFLAAQR